MSTVNTDDLVHAIDTLPDDQLRDVIGRSLQHRPNLRLVRDQITALLAMGPNLDANLNVRLHIGELAAAAAQARIVADATSSLLNEHPMLDSTAVSRVLGKAPSSRNTASRLAGAGKVIALPVGQARQYPRFQFDAARRQVRPIVAEINQLLDAAGDPWGVASWWLSPTDFGDDPRSPADLAVSGGHDEDLRAMARDLLAD